MSRKVLVEIKIFEDSVDEWLEHKKVPKKNWKLVKTILKYSISSADIHMEQKITYALRSLKKRKEQ